MLKLMKDLISQASFTPVSYSGRGMHGELCVGFRCPDVQIATGELYEVILDDPKYRELLSHVKTACSDNFGKGEIVYFPTIEWSE